MFFILSKNPFSFSKYSSFCVSVFPSFFPVSHWLRGLSNINLKVYDVRNCLNKNSITYFVCFLEKQKKYGIDTLSVDRILSKEYFYGKIMQKYFPKGSPRPPFNFSI